MEDMGDDIIRPRASAQQGVLSRWQLLQDTGAGAADWATADLRRPFSGVYLTGWGPITPRQTWLAATLTAPETALDRAAAGAFWEILRDTGHLITVVRPGNRGRNRSGRLVVRYSRTLEGNVVTVDGIRVTTPERTIIDLWPHLSPWARSKMLREALRKQVTTPALLLAAIHSHQRRAGVGVLRAEILDRIHLPFDRCRSDAEAYGLVILDDAGVEIPQVNERFADEEADFCWADRRDITEIDGPQWHRFKEDDARKTVIWTRAGYRVRRIDSELVFREPAALLRLAPPPVRRPKTHTPTWRNGRRTG